MDILVYKWISYTIHFHKRSYHRLSEKYFQIKSNIEIMSSWTILWGLTVVITVFCSVSGKEFCYNDDEGCGPNTDAWSGTCRNGTRQSPIDLPSTQNASGYGIISLQLKNYRGSFFRIRNSGHTLVVDFVGESGQNEGPSAKILRFPDPLKVTPYSYGQVREYKLSSAHFHWGTKGSEHCINKVCSAMELHLVHYLAKYKSPTEALDSKDPNALAVIGVLIDTNPKKREASIDTTSALAPIIKNLDKVLEPTENQYTVVNESLDLTPLLVTESPFIFIRTKDR
ncbi:Carbonic anhydrase [Orchesella cincta]|uniref:carbonic anhydrase n=1 Tax=Orchesella cincta TaxID=48709 RepID=A0A1D2MHQ4_ORCCI|nr:Carbonic anhydrase [Orchesella cincta]